MRRFLSGFVALSVVAGLSVAAGSTAQADPVSAGAFHPVPSTRVVDTRTGVGIPAGSLTSGADVAVVLGGLDNVPAVDGTSVVISITAMNPTVTGNLIAYAHGTTRPSVTTLNYAAGLSATNLAVVQLGGGKVDFYNAGAGSLPLAVDLVGYYTAGPAAAPGTFQATSPTRLLDTRTGVGSRGALAPSAVRRVQIAGSGPVPAGAVAVVVNLTSVKPAGAGTLAAYPSGETRSGGANVNFAAGQNVNGLSIVRIGSDGGINIQFIGTGSVDVVADVSGYILGGDVVDDGALVTGPARRVLDTRTSGGPPVTGVAVTANVATSEGTPPATLGSVLALITVIQPSGSGVVRAYAHGSGLPVATDISFHAGLSAANLAVIPVPADGRLDLTVVGAGTGNVVVDIVGSFLGDSADTMPPATVSGLSVTPSGAHTAVLSWTNPTTTDFTAVMVRRQVGAVAPSTPTAGTLVADVSASGYTDSGLTSDATYSYAVFAHDGWPNYATPVSGTVVTGPLTWTAKTIDPPGGDPVTISCLSRAFCMAADLNGAVLRYDGTNWHKTQVGPTGHTDDGDLQTIDCASTTFCMVLGRGAIAYRYNGVTWTRTSIPGAHLYMSVSCPASTFCAAIANDGYVSVYRSGAWTGPVHAFNGGDTAAVSCVSSSFCMATGETPAGHPQASRFDGVHWSTPSTPFAAPGYPESVSCTSPTFCAIAAGDRSINYDGHAWSAHRMPAGLGDYQWLSCVSATFCTAIDYGGRAARWDGSVWRLTGDIAPDRGLAGIGCATTTMCGAVDRTDRYYRWTGATWVPSIFDATRGGPSMTVSCPSVLFCMAGDHSGNAIRGNAGTWSAPVPVIPEWGGGFGDNQVSCASSTFCLASSSTHTYRFNGAAWSVVGVSMSSISCSTAGLCLGERYGQIYRLSGSAWIRIAAHGNDYDSWAISCAGPSFCLLVDGSGQVWRYNGVQLVAAGQVTSSYPSYAVACVSGTFCLIVATDGTYYAFRGVAVSARTSLLNNTFQSSSVTCASAEMCVAANSDGAVAVYDGTTWATQRVVDAVVDNVERVGGVSCPSVSFCVLTDGDQAYTGR
jgi:hypothetical protein